MNKEAIEVCIFKLVENTQKSNFISANEEINDWLNQQSGFKFRCLSEKEDGTWIDIVHWESMSDAKAASENFLGVFGESDFMKAINPESLSMNHGEIHLALVN